MNELSKGLLCIYIRNGIEIWVEEDRVKLLTQNLFTPNPPQFFEYQGRPINRADLVGVFTAKEMEELTRRKNGQWKCLKSNWHEKRQECECRNREPEIAFVDEISDEQRLETLKALDKLKKQLPKNLL